MIAELKPYPEYRESELAWLGDVPSHWHSGPGFSAFREKKVKNTGLQEKTVLSLSYGRIIVKPEDKLHGLVPESFETYQIVDPGDIIIRSTDLQNDKTSLRVGIVKNRGIITSAYMCMKVTETLMPEYGYQLLHTLDLTKILYGLGSGLRQNLDYSDFKRLPLSIPPIDEQTSIVRFLNHANLRIEKAIRAKRKVIALLNEQKQVIIHRAVTRGLDPNVQLKPSGIPWLGDIPGHWEDLRSKYVFHEVDERSVTGTETHLSMSQKYGLIPNSQIEERRLVSESYVGAKLCRSGDLVLNRLKAHLGVFALAPGQGLISPDYTVFRPARPMVARYFEAMYRTPACRVELRKRAKGIVQGFWRLYTDDFYDIRVPVPPLDEQYEIMQYLDKELLVINTVIASTEREIDLLREYRTRLIADVVTGKLDVRQAAARLPDELEELATLQDCGETAELDDNGLDAEDES
ncbi:restriction endonuclease subunit S [Trichlorobacter lovleyi]|uniref:Type I restriction-modification system specificity subunit n=1 Tax=Trichlorobacter lovleyi (strain ATCC BAA-1151 / DSM 17278 / SZ) TaxID=398767 RepID=B3E495_TRIL1|nr:restriction endonuclease subunit S [Trichlorobacter lovleyi]ACD95916.1 type I restriction-modification system specificity subunit [Trichlorobacter lovleyi SZ]